MSNWGENFAATSSVDLFSMLISMEERKKLTPAEFRAITLQFISNFIALAVTRELHRAVPGHSKKEAYEHAYGNFKDIKRGIEDNAARGFQEALSSFSGKPVEYYCKITPVGDPVNKRPC